MLNCSAFSAKNWLIKVEPTSKVLFFLPYTSRKAGLAVQNGYIYASGNGKWRRNQRLARFQRNVTDDRRACAVTIISLSFAMVLVGGAPFIGEPRNLGENVIL